MVPSNEEELRARGIYYITGALEEGTLKDIHMDILLKHLDRWEGDIQIILNTPGGETPECWSFVDLLDFVIQDIKTVALGEVCSAGAIILASGTPGKRFCSANTSLMIHPVGAYGLIEGKYPELVSQMKGLDNEHQKHIRHWMRCSNLKTETEIIEKLLAPTDRWFTPEELKTLGIVDEVVPLKPRLPASKRSAPKTKK
jgi:ATP-dependent Clp protease protease subunit